MMACCVQLFANASVGHVRSRMAACLGNGVANVAVGRRDNWVPLPNSLHGLGKLRATWLVT